MAKVRLHEISKQINLSGKELFDKLKELGIEHKNNMSASIEDFEAKKVIANLAGRAVKIEERRDTNLINNIANQTTAEPEKTVENTVLKRTEASDLSTPTVGNREQRTVSPNNKVELPAHRKRRPERNPLVAERPRERPASERPGAEKPSFDRSLLDRSYENRSTQQADGRMRTQRPTSGDRHIRPLPAGERQSGEKQFASRPRPEGARPAPTLNKSEQQVNKAEGKHEGSAIEVQTKPAVKKDQAVAEVKEAQQLTPEKAQNIGLVSAAAEVTVAEKQTAVHDELVRKQPDSEPVRNAASEDKSSKPQTDNSMRAQSDQPLKLHNDRPASASDRQRPQSDRTHTPRPQSQSDRPYNSRSQGQGDRPYTQRSHGQGDRPYTSTSRPQGDRPYTPRPKNQGDRPYTPRPQGGAGQSQGQGGFTRSGYQGQKPQGSTGGFGSGFKKDGFGKDDGKRDDYRNASSGRASSGKKDGARPAEVQPKKEDIAAKREDSRREEARREQNKKREIEKAKNDKSKGGKGTKADAKARIIAPVVQETKIVELPKVMTVKEFAEAIHKSGAEVVKYFFSKGEMLTITSDISFETATAAAEHFGILVEEEREVDIFDDAFGEKNVDTEVIERPPVVVVMGHVDHGKTSLLDAIRQANVTSGEAGGITQHIGAYMVSINNRPITFLDTPGHEAFTAMRMRGAQVTDIAVLVVAADDGVMPQTVEAINHAKAAGLDIIVAINKIDKPSSNPDRVKQELIEHGLQAEDWGGETICVPVSAMQRTGIEHLLEMIILVAEVKELKANPNKSARGTIVEAQLDKGKGPVATVLVQNGTLQVGDPIVAGGSYGKIRAMIDDKGKRVKKAGPSMPVAIQGLNDVPSAGDVFYVAQSEKQARSLAEQVVAKGRVEMIKSAPQITAEGMFEQMQGIKVKDLNIIIKADVQGSVEAVRQSLEKLSNEEVKIRIIHLGVGSVTESDVTLASASNAIIISFNVKPEVTAKSIADEQGVDIRMYRIIYNAIEDIEKAMKGMLEPIYKEKIIGHAEIRQLFKASGVGTIAGSYVTDGKITRSSKVRIFRDGKEIYDGTFDTIRRFKDDVKEVNSNYECGFVFTKFNDIKEGDTCEAYVMEEIAR